MKTLNFCLSVTVHSAVLSSSAVLEEQYQNCLKKLISYLYDNPSFKMSFSFSGPQIEWLEKTHPEFLQLLRELVARKQVEMIGGGYYNPVFPLLFPVDRTGQIELLTGEIRRITGRRPRGMTVLSSVWDSSLIPCFQNCGMEWIQLDSSLISAENRHFLPHILSEQGKSIKVLPVSRNWSPSAHTDTTPELYVSNILKCVEKSAKNDGYSRFTDDRVICVNFEPDELEKLMSSKWLGGLFAAVESNERTRFSLPTEFINSSKEFVPSFIPAGVRDDVAKWSVSPYQSVELKRGNSYTIHNFMLTYGRIKALYNRMIYVSMIISNCHGDKARKSAARTSLWKAQSGEAYICSPGGMSANNALRQAAYRHLTEAEKFIREAGPFRGSITSYDYDFDGYSEYVCSMEKFTACINPHGGEISELNIISNTGNYTDNLVRNEKFDKVSDFYQRGFFVEHFLTKDEWADYKKGLPAGDGTFSRVLFENSGFLAKKNEIRLSGKGSFSSMALPVTLRKKYIANSGGFTIQYILRNDSPISIKGIFAVESNFAQTDFSSASTNSYKTDVISAGECITWDKIARSASSRNVSFVQITDTSNDISFVFEPNEDAGIVCRPLYFRRPCETDSKLNVSATTFVSTLFWEIDLAAGLEIEKTVNFAIITPKKRRSKAK